MKKKIAAAFWQLFKGYWSSEEKWKARGLLAVVIGMQFAMVYLLVQLNSWYNEFYNALQAYQVEQFWPLIGKFSAIAFVYITIAVYAIYLRQLLQLKWRCWMTNEYLGAWLKKQAYYRLQVLGRDMDNPEQRIQDDIGEFVSLTLQLLLNFLKNITTLGAFAVVLWNLSGVIEVPIGGHSYQVYGYMLWVSVIYSAVGTVLVHFVGRKLISLNFDQQRYEADFRYAMTRVRENSESIAFYGGELSENAGFAERFNYVVSNFRQLMTQTKILNTYANFYAQLAVIVPLILAAPRYFAGEIALGGLMQTSSAFGRVQDALSFFVDSYDAIAKLVAVIERLAGFTEHLEEVSELQSELQVAEGEDSGLSLENVTVAVPGGRELLTGCTLALPQGSKVLVTGASGCGKSTLLRTLAGFWPFGRGTVRWPQQAKLLFLPQRPYLPLGTLRRAISYPQTEIADDARLRQVLALVDLAPLAEKLDTVDDWSRILSLGEQQRIAFARVLLAAPDWLFLDEATSALDEPREQALYETLQRELPQLSFISVGHRSTLLAQHSAQLNLSNGGFALRPLHK